MTGKFSTDEFNKSQEKLSSSVEGVNRYGMQNPENLVDSVKDLVYRCLDSDVDSVFFLLTLLKNREVIACSKLLTDLVESVRVSSFAHQHGGEVTQRDLDNIVDVLDEMLSAPKGQRELLSSELEGHVQNLVRRNATASGAVLSGPSAASAREVIKRTADSVFFNLPSVRASANEFRRAVVSYDSSDFESVSAYMQTKAAMAGLNDSFSEYEDPQKFLLDSAVSAALIRNASKKKRDIREPKYLGEVSVLPAASAKTLGGTSPFIIPTVADSRAEFSISDGEEGSSEVGLSLPLSPTPTTTFSCELVSSETGFLIEGLNAGDKLTKVYSSLLYDGTTASPDGEFLTSPKVPVVPGSVKVILTVKNTDTEDINTYELVDMSFGEVFPDIADEGSLVDASNPAAVFGSIKYQLGEIHLDISTNVTSPEYLDGSIYCEYQYYRIGTRLNWERENCEDISKLIELSSTFDKFFLICGNNLYEATLDTPRQVTGTPPTESEYPVMVKDYDDLRNLLSNASWVFYDSASTPYETEAPVYFNATDSGVEVVAKPAFAGSASRIRFPNLVSAEKYDGFGGPRFDAQPSSLNQLLSAPTQDVYGSDSSFSQVTVDDPDSVANTKLITQKVGSEVLTTKYRWSSEVSAICLDDFPSSAQVGDDVYETTLGWHSKIAGFSTLSDGSEVATLSPPPPLGTGGTTVDYIRPIDCTVRFTRDRPRVSAASDSATATITTTVEALGFSGSEMGSSTRVALTKVQAGLTNSVYKPGYRVKKGDVVYENVLGTNYREIGRVGVVEGDSITIVINPDTEFEYPFSNIKINGLGLHNHIVVDTALSNSISELTGVDVDHYRKLSVTFATSGAAHGEYIQTTLGLISSISQLRNTYLKYDSHVVNTVNVLLEYLKQEKLTVVSDLLLGAKFSKIPDLTPQEVAGQGDIEAMLDQAAALYGSNVENTEARVGFNPLTDFINRGSNNNVDPGTPPQDFPRGDS